MGLEMFELDERQKGLLEKYRDRNIKEELCWCMQYTKHGYMDKDEAEFYSWMCLKAYLYIKKLEQELVEEINRKDD